MISRHAMTPSEQVHRTTRYARALRDRLMVRLGGCCALFQATENLQFDHIHGAHHYHNRLSYGARMKRYEREAELGLIRILCAACNLKERRRNDNGAHIRTIDDASGIIPLTPDMPF